MIIYFADRQMEILGQASTSLPNGFRIIEDTKTEEIETGVATFSCRIAFDKDTRTELERMTNAGNYLLRSHDGENEFYTIIDTEIDTKNQDIYVYAEDAGLDLINEIVGDFEADDSYSAEWYINKYIADSGFEIGLNEIPASAKRKLSWEGEATVTSRLASIATQFGGYEISYSYAIKGLEITNKYINIHEKRGKDEGVTLRLNIDIDKIVTTKSVANLATAFLCEGGVPDNDDKPITFSSTGYKYDDGDFYISGDRLISRKASEKWKRHGANNGFIVRPYSYNTEKPDELCSHAITELKKVCDMEVNYEIDIMRVPEGVKIGDRINIVDDAGEMYVSTRILMLEVSVVDQKRKFTLGENLIKTSGISQKVADMAAQFAVTSQSAARAYYVAKNAATEAETANAVAETAYSIATASQGDSVAAGDLARSAVNSSSTAQKQAAEALAAVAEVEEKVAEIEVTVENANTAANNAVTAAQTATTKAEEAQTAANNAAEVANEAKNAAGSAQTSAAEATSKADTAISTADEAKTKAESASETANAAKADAEQAKKDVAALGDELETLSSTMQADYARKTELTETESKLQTQISQNAASITSIATQVTTIDETANDAKDKAEAAQNAAGLAQSQADQATADAQAAQNAANEAASAAATAQSEADTAKAAAEAARSVADKAESDLATAKSDLESVTSRVDATEEEIAAAQAAVESAQSAADKAKDDADEAVQKATEAQTKANTAVTNAANAQTVANNAANQAALAQQVADEAKGEASAAQTKADEAASVAAEAQRKAAEAVTNATNAQAAADQAAADAATAQQAAEDADAKAAQAQSDLNTAKQNLADVTSRVGATEQEVEAAQAAVVTAQAAADKAAEDAEAAQATANTAKANAATAQTAADNAKTAADNAQTAAEEAQAAADKAQADVDSLAVRVTTAETKIEQNSEQISLMAKKTEVAVMLGGYSTKEETEAAIQLKADAITSSVSSTYATKQEVEDIEIGGRNLLANTDFKDASGFNVWNQVGSISETADGLKFTGGNSYSGFVFPLAKNGNLENGVEYTLSFTYRTNLSSLGSLYILQETDPNVHLGQPVIKASETEWAHFELTFSNASINDRVCRAILFPYASGSGNWIEIKSETLKLEKGNKATDWTPAPEDVDSAIDLAQSTAFEANDSATSANERITASESIIQQLSNCIAMMVTDENGQSLMTQTEDGWTFSMKETTEAISSLMQSVGTLVTDSGSTQAAVDILKQAIDDHGATLKYVNVTTYEDEPCIELGESASDFKLLITNTRIMFMNGGNVPTYINTNGLVTQDIEVKGEIVQGGYVMVNTSDGGWGLLWKGVIN